MAVRSRYTNGTTRKRVKKPSPSRVESIRSAIGKVQNYLEKNQTAYRKAHPGDTTYEQDMRKIVGTFLNETSKSHEKGEILRSGKRDSDDEIARFITGRPAKKLAQKENEKKVVHITIRRGDRHGNR